MFSLFRDPHSRGIKKFAKALRAFFPEAFCINLDHRGDRWAFFEGQMKKLGLAGFVKRFPGVYLKTGEYAPRDRLQQGKYSILSCCGVMLSHRGIVKMAKEAGMEKVLVFEDDAWVLEENIGALAPALLDLEKQDWRAFFLGATHNRPMTRVTPNLLKVPEGAHGLQAIAYHARIYDDLLRVLPEDPMEWIEAHRYPVDAIDVWLQNEGVLTGEIYCPDPIIVVQKEFSSDISNIENFDIAKFQIDHFNRFRPAN